jgi:hypothetical protein
MPSAGKFLLCGFICCLHIISFAQRAKYADVYTGYGIKIAGYINNTIHAWSASGDLPRLSGRDITLSLYIFSPDLQLLEEKKIPLGKLQSWSVNFHFTDSCYYAGISYFSESRRNLLLKIDRQYNLSEVTNGINIWQKLLLNDQKTRHYATLKQEDTVFAARTEHLDAPDSAYIDYNFLPGEIPAAGNITERLVIRKVNLGNREWIEQVIGSAGTQFSQPLLYVSDTTLLAASLIQRQERKRSVNSNATQLLLARFNTGFSSPAHAIGIIAGKAGLKNETYVPFALYTAGNNILLLSRGIAQRQTTYFVPQNQSGIIAQAPRVFSINVINSLKITLVDSANALVKDTVITSRGGGEIQWDEQFITSGATGVDIFCARKYKGSKNGVTHFHINKEGGVSEEDLILDVSYTYLMSRAIQPAPGVLLIPYSKKGRISLLKLHYSLP